MCNISWENVSYFPLFIDVFLGRFIIGCIFRTSQNCYGCRNHQNIYAAFLLVCLKYKITNTFMKYAGKIKKIKRHCNQIHCNRRYRYINLLQRPSKHLKSSCFKTVDKESRFDIVKAKSKVYYSILITFKLIEPSSLRRSREEDLFLEQNIFMSPLCMWKTQEPRLWAFQ